MLRPTSDADIGRRNRLCAQGVINDRSIDLSNVGGDDQSAEIPHDTTGRRHGHFRNCLTAWRLSTPPRCFGRWVTQLGRDCWPDWSRPSLPDPAGRPGKGETNASCGAAQNALCGAPRQAPATGKAHFYWLERIVDLVRSAMDPAIERAPVRSLSSEREKLIPQQLRTTLIIGISTARIVDTPQFAMTVTSITCTMGTCITCIAITSTSTCSVWVAAIRAMHVECPLRRPYARTGLRP